MRNFIRFIRSQGVVGLAIGFILGGSVSSVVSALVQDIVNPLLGLVLGNFKNLGEYQSSIGQAAIKWGDFIVSLLDFITIAAVVFFIFQGLHLEKLDEKKDSK